METLEPSSICLDTSVLIDNLRGRKQVVEFIRRIEEDGTALSTTAVNCFELYYGAYKSKKQERNLAAAKTLLKRLVILDLAEESSHEAGRILALLEAKGKPIGFRDALIAAISIVHKMAFVTGDVEHFSRVPNLEILEAP